LYIFLVLDLLWLPGRPMLQHGIENGQQLMHARRQGDFFDFPRREEPLVKSLGFPYDDFNLYPYGFPAPTL